MFWIEVRIQAEDPPLSIRGPIKTTSEFYVTNRADARKEFDRLLELMGLPTARPVEGMPSAEDLLS
jgi:hypothetical protein